MTADPQSAREDLAFLRGLVDGDPRPGMWNFGAFYVAIGIVLILHMAISAASWRLAIPAPAPLLAYIALYTVFYGATLLIGRRSRALFGAANAWASPSSTKDRAGGAALVGAFLAHLVILIAFAAAAWRLGDGRIMALLVVTLFASQGAAWIVVHAMRRHGWHGALAWAWFAAALGAGFLTGSAWLEPFVAVSAFALMVLPGIHMMRAARRPD